MMFLHIKQHYSNISMVKINVMHLIFNLLSTNGLYMFRALLAHPQGALHKRHMVYYLRAMSVGCTAAN
jgi:hypothetical protein